MAGSSDTECRVWSSRLPVLNKVAREVLVTLGERPYRCEGDSHKDPRGEEHSKSRCSEEGLSRIIKQVQGRVCG